MSVNTGGHFGMSYYCLAGLIVRRKNPAFFQKDFDEAAGRILRSEFYPSRKAAGTIRYSGARYESDAMRLALKAGALHSICFNRGPVPKREGTLQLAPNKR
jgi:hypothetical protein